MSGVKLPDLCTQCGTCRDACLAEQLGGHTITTFLSGGETFSSWLCSCCWLCQEVCPKGVDIHELMIEARRSSQAPNRYDQAYSSVRSCGYAFSIDEEINNLRRSYDLVPLVLITPERLRHLLTDRESDQEGQGKGHA